MTQANVAQELQLKWGILGTGNIAKTLALAINASKTGHLLAVGSRSQEAADKFGAEHSIERRYDTYDKVLERPGRAGRLHFAPEPSA